VGARKLAEQRVEAARVLESLQGALATDAALLSEAESQAIAAATQALQQAAQGEDPAAIEDAIKTLDAQTQDFAARRMDASIRRALAGHSVDEV
jgi:molecular chaperone HscA